MVISHSQILLVFKEWAFPLFSFYPKVRGGGSEGAGKCAASEREGAGKCAAPERENRWRVTAGAKPE